MARVSSGTKILVVDDDLYVRRSLQAVLEAEGYQVITAQHGLDGLRLLQEEHPDLVILDALMPDMDGWETCRRMRGLSTVPIFILSARQSEEDRLRSLQAGATEHLIKPVSLNELHARIRTALGIETGSSL